MVPKSKFWLVIKSSCSFISSFYCTLVWIHSSTTTTTHLVMVGVLVEYLLLGLAKEVLEVLDERRVLLVVRLLEVHLQLDHVVQVRHADGAQEPLPHFHATRSHSGECSTVPFRILILVSAF